MYYRGANAALLLYDITNAASFESVRGWLEGLALFIPSRSSIPRGSTVQPSTDWAIVQS